MKKLQEFSEDMMMIGLTRFWLTHAKVKVAIPRVNEISTHGEQSRSTFNRAQLPTSSTPYCARSPSGST